MLLADSHPHLELELPAATRGDNQMKCRNTRGRCKKLRAGWLLELDEVRHPGWEEGLSSQPHCEGQCGWGPREDGRDPGAESPSEPHRPTPSGTGHSRAGQATGDWKAPWPHSYGYEHLIRHWPQQPQWKNFTNFQERTSEPPRYSAKEGRVAIWELKF